MLRLAVLACVLVCIFAKDDRINVPGCGRRPLNGKGEYHSDKVVGGQVAKPGDWGWQISLLFNGRHNCGGSLINSEWVVTAAHCVSSTTLSSYSIHLGLHDRNQPESWAFTRGVSAIFRHPSYSSSTYKNDIALIRLASPVNNNFETDNYIIPVCWYNTTDGLDNEFGWATGWGSTFSGGSVTTTLREVNFKIVTDAYCGGAGSQYGSAYDPVTMICAGEKDDGKDTCQGDSGGPLMIEKNKVTYLIGLTSWGYGCGQTGVYTRTSTYFDWTQNIISNN